ncbi:hypothetical protein KKG22_05555 [Patescibacteria group bacterium]|nr:hypothetical protein [Patescibacteria group bacterium]
MLDELLREECPGENVWVPGIMNGAMGATLRLMAAADLLTEAAKEKLGLKEG